MDFSRDHGEWGKSYYTSEQQTKILGYIADTIEGMDWYESVRPEGLLQFHPFLGVNPQVHGLAFIEELFDRFVCTTKPAKRGKSGGNTKRFRGIKLYPPLGMNPWPESGIEREKVEFIYRFCQDHRLPIITHCDDQGFRGVAAKLAQQYTAPRSWRPVLERYPDLKIDFAHYGRQYNLLARRSPLNVLMENNFTKDPWFLDIIALMRKYQHVYADVSFSGTDPKFYEHLHAFLDAGEGDAQFVMERSLFGSDFTVNLAKVESYTNYYRIFETSPFSDEVVHAFSSINAKRFLGL
jgi:predicted TIM-barrel fold metal-dependent hydrolase